MMDQLLVLVEERLRKKEKRAEEAYVRENTTKHAKNCRHGGRALSDHLSVCKLRCQGESEIAAAQCWQEKASGCPDFTLKRSVQAIRTFFRNMPEAEKFLRWPSIKELYWIREQIRILKARGPDDGNVPPSSDRSTRNESERVTPSDRKGHILSSISNGYSNTEELRQKESQSNNEWNERTRRGNEKTQEKAVLVSSA